MRFGKMWYLAVLFMILFHANVARGESEKNASIELIEGIEETMLFKVPEDDLYSEQWQIQMINADFAWEAETYGNDVNVAVIDSGCNPHIDLGVNLVGGYNYVAENDDYSDNIGHGTHVTGIIGAQMNSIGITGVAPKVNIYALKCFEKNESTTFEMLASAINDAVDKYNCKVINMSLGTGTDNKDVRKAVKHAYDKGSIIVAAVGNDGTSSLKYPAGYDEVIGVGSVGINKIKSYFSQKNSSVDVVAPGESVVSLKGVNSYTYMEGTSQASPQVAGAAAIALSANEDITPKEFKSLIQTTSEDLGEIGRDNLYGWGLINISAMMKAIMGKCYVSPINNGEILIINNGTENLSAAAIWCMYSEDKYLGCETKEIFLLPQKKIKLTHEKSTNDIKFFLWQSPESLKPMARKRQ